MFSLLLFSLCVFLLSVCLSSRVLVVCFLCRQAWPLVPRGTFNASNGHIIMLQSKTNNNGEEAASLQYIIICTCKVSPKSQQQKKKQDLLCLLRIVGLSRRHHQKSKLITIHVVSRNKESVMITLLLYYCYETNYFFKRQLSRKF